MKSRDTYCGIDLLKFILSILVVLRHCGQNFFNQRSGYVFVITNTLSTVAVPMFFAISGFLLWRKPVDSKRVKNQIIRLIKLYLLWSLIYFPFAIKVYWNFKGTKKLGTYITEYMQNFFFNGSYYHLWFLPSLIVGIIVVYLLSLVTNNKGILVITGILFLIGLIGEPYSFLLNDTTILDKYNEVFLTTRNGLFFASFFVCLGKIISRYKPNLDAMRGGTTLSLS